LRTRHQQLEAHTDLADRIFRAGKNLLGKEVDGTDFRLLGIGVTDLTDARLEMRDLVDAEAEKRAKAEQAMDAIRVRFGQDGLTLGLTFSAKPSRDRKSR
jgi:DNA polymerase-4